MKSGNIFDNIPKASAEEIFESIFECETLRFERIVSSGQSSPDGFWYDQPQDEWVMLLSGKAVLRFEQEAEPVSLNPGDYLLIPAHTKHRVESTDRSQQTVWLALHFNFPLI